MAHFQERIYDQTERGEMSTPVASLRMLSRNNVAAIRPDPLGFTA